MTDLKYLPRPMIAAELTQRVHESLQNCVIFCSLFHSLTLLEDGGGVGRISLWRSIMYHIITAVKSYICILGTQYLIVLRRVNYNEYVVKGQSLAEGRFIEANACCVHKPNVGEIEPLLFWLQVTASITRLSSCHIIMSHLFALYPSTH